MTDYFETARLTIVFSGIYIFQPVLTDQGNFSDTITFQELSGLFERYNSF